MNIIQFIQIQISAAPKNIENTIKLLEEDCKIHFISRYRKDQTGNLDEVVIEQIAKRKKQFEEIVKRKEVILKAIAEQQALTPELEKKIQDSFDLQELEDYYLPFKKKKKTRADVARENGLEPLAKIIMAQNNDDVDFVASRYLNDKVLNEDQALQGARDIIAEWINENTYVRKLLRRLFTRTATITTKVVKTKKDDENAQKFSQYFDWSENITKAPAHRLLAMLRAEHEGFIKIKVEIESADAIANIEDVIIKRNNDCTSHLKLAIEDSYKRLLVPAISNETLQEAKAKKCQLVVSHHPLLLEGVHTVAEGELKGDILSFAITNSIALFSAHTNADIVPGGVSDVLANKIGIKNSVPLVGTTGESGHGRIGNLDQPMTVRELAQRINEILPATHAPIRVAGNATAKVSRVAVVGGSGGSFLPDAISAGAECFVTSDLKHHVSLDVVTDQAQSISLIDISHFAAESLWLKPTQVTLSTLIPGVSFVVSQISTDPWSMSVQGRRSSEG
jgi:dinuclear metal center YbgI/SA1388 family protein